MQFTGKIIVSILLFSFAVINSFGCTPQRKMLPPDKMRPPSASSSPNPYVRQKSLEETTGIVKALQTKLELIPGVRKAYVASSGNTALIGLVLSGPSSGPAAEHIKGLAIKRATTDRRILHAYVTTDAKWLPRIRYMHYGELNGRPSSDFEPEFSRIVSRITPQKSSRTGAPVL